MPRGGRTVSSSNRDRFDLDGAAPKVWEAINARRGRKIPGLAKVGATPIPLSFHVDGGLRWCGGKRRPGRSKRGYSDDVGRVGVTCVVTCAV